MANPFNCEPGTLTGTGLARTITLGYRPAYVKIIDQTNNIIWEFVDGMMATHTLRQTIASPAVNSVTTSSDIAISDTGFSITATLNASSAALVYIAVREGA